MPPALGQAAGTLEIPEGPIDDATAVELADRLVARRLDELRERSSARATLPVIVAVVVVPAGACRCRA